MQDKSHQGRALPFALGRYTLFDWVGRGGMADIYLARTKTGLGATRLVVIKEIIEELRDNEQFVDMLIAEAKLAAQLSHANVVGVEDLGRDEGTLYIAMDYVEGIDLRDVLRQCSKRKIALPFSHSLTVMCEILKALHYAHRYRGHTGELAGIVHRDVSPSNVLLSFDGEVKLCDFGIAAVVTAGGIDAETIEGKAGYMSPEQARGETIDTRSDIYAVGILLWELLNGRRLYRAPKGERLIDVARRAEVPPVKRRGLQDEERLHEVVGRALKVAVDERYQSAGDMLRDLEDYCVGAAMMVSPIRLGDWLREHFDDERISQRRGRERALKALDLGPPVVLQPLSGPRSSKSDVEEPDASESPDSSSVEEEDGLVVPTPPSSRAEVMKEARAIGVRYAVQTAIGLLLILWLLNSLGIL